MRSSRGKAPLRMTTLGVRWDPQSFKKPHNVFLSEFYFFIRFTVHFSRLTDFNKWDCHVTSFLAMTSQSSFFLDGRRWGWGWKPKIRHAMV